MYIGKNYQFFRPFARQGNWNVYMPFDAFVFVYSIFPKISLYWSRKPWMALELFPHTPVSKAINSDWQLRNWLKYSTIRISLKYIANRQNNMIWFMGVYELSEELSTLVYVHLRKTTLKVWMPILYYIIRGRKESYRL